MQTRLLNYRIIVSPDVETGTGKKGYTAFCPTLGIADDGDSIEESIENLKNAIHIYIESLAEDKMPIPVDHPEQDIVTTTQIYIPSYLKLAV